MLGAYLLSHIPLFVEEFARGGGGGSGGDGGGAGGIFFLIGAIGYIPMHIIGAKLRKHFHNIAGWGVAQIISWVSVSIIGIILIILAARLDSALGEIYGALPIAIGALLGTGAGLYGWFDKVKQSKQTQEALQRAAQNDAAWDEVALTNYATQVFYKYQQDWSTFNVESMKSYISQNYYNHTLLMLYALKAAHRVNSVTNPVVTKALITEVADHDDNRLDRVTVGFEAKANDQLIDDRTNQIIFTDTKPFAEFWHFIRQGNAWIFDGITQGTQNALKLRPEIQQYANQNGLYYAPDWGWLLLPTDGYLFKNGKFGVSDINNHMIGFVNNVLTQGYTYTPVAANNAGGDQYLVMQTNVPKTYGRILVKRKSKLINWPVAGLTHIKMEWGEFNDIYDVYASDLEKVTSFELLNPAFMAVLRDAPFEVNIEVVDNAVYLFTKATTDLNHYAALYQILLQAHKEMKL